MTRKLATNVLITVGCIVGLLTTHIFVWYRVPDNANKTCTITRTPQIVNSIKVISWMDIVFYSILPSLIIICGNSIIVLTLIRSRNMSTIGVKGDTSLQKSFNKIIPMLLLVSTVFVLCTLPVGIFKAGKCTLPIRSYSFG